jgi:hypothetical protein
METVEKKKLRIILSKLLDNTNKAFESLMLHLSELEDCDDFGSINKKIRIISEDYERFKFYAGRLDKLEALYSLPSSTKSMHETVEEYIDNLGIYVKVVKSHNH